MRKGRKAENEFETMSCESSAGLSYDGGRLIKARRSTLVVFKEPIVWTVFVDRSWQLKGIWCRSDLDMVSRFYYKK